MSIITVKATPVCQEASSHPPGSPSLRQRCLSFDLGYFSLAVSVPLGLPWIEILVTRTLTLLSSALVPSISQLPPGSPAASLCPLGLQGIGTLLQLELLFVDPVLLSSSELSALPPLCDLLDLYSNGILPGWSSSFGPCLYLRFLLEPSHGGIPVSNPFSFPPWTQKFH